MCIKAGITYDHALARRKKGRGEGGGPDVGEPFAYTHSRRHSSSDKVAGCMENGIARAQSPLSLGLGEESEGKKENNSKTLPGSM